MAATEPYRTLPKKEFDSSSEEEGQITDSGSSDECSGKRMKISESSITSSSLPNQNVTGTSGASMQPNVRPKRRNNIWGSVLADQSSNEISHSLGTVGMKQFMSRGPESFSLELAHKDRRMENPAYSSSDDEELEKEEELTIEEEMESYMIARHHLNNQTNKIIQPKKQNLKRKRPKKRKPGQVPKYQPGQKVTLNKKVDISADDTEDIVAEEIAFRLWEKKKELIKTIVLAIGTERALFLFKKTEALELSGGLMTMQGDRRRTPGGTFLFLLRKDPDLDQDKINKIFEAESLREKERWLASKQSVKQQREALNVGETPQNSPSTSNVNSIATASGSNLIAESPHGADLAEEIELSDVEENSCEAAEMFP